MKLYEDKILLLGASENLQIIDRQVKSNLNNVCSVGSLFL